MKTFQKIWAVSIATLSIFGSSAMATPELQYRKTTCNLRYNNLGIIANAVSCRAWFDYAGTLNRSVFHYNGKQYDWPVGTMVTKDPRWPECIRYTFPNGNQWQLCTVPSPSQLNIKVFN